MAKIHDIIKGLLQDTQNPLITEIGSHTGDDTLALMQRIPNGSFYCFEPLPSNYKKLQERFRGNGNIMMYDLALADAQGAAEFHVSSDPKGFNGSSSLLKPKDHLTHFPHVKFNEKIQVYTSTLDHFFWGESLSQIDLIWCDAQGAELAIINGGQRALKRTKYLYFEHYENHEMYQGQGTLDQCLSSLPGKWDIVEKFPNDILVKNLEFKASQLSLNDLISKIV